MLYVLFQHEVTGNTKCSLLNYVIRETNNENCVSPCVGTYSWHFDLILVATIVLTWLDEFVTRTGYCNALLFAMLADVRFMISLHFLL